MKKLIGWMLLCLAMLLLNGCTGTQEAPSAPADAPQTALPVYPYAVHGEPVAEHASDTLWWRIERTAVDGASCYLAKVCMADPGRQIGKAAADWEENVLSTKALADRAPEASLLINGSGYVTRVFS